MKKLIVLISIFFSLLLCGCDNLENEYTTYYLKAVLLEGEDIDVPIGQISINLKNDATLLIDDQKCTFHVEKDDATINGLKAKVDYEDEIFILNFKEVKLKYIFCKTDLPYERLQEEKEKSLLDKEEEEEGYNLNRKNVEGRLFFTNTLGSFQEYEGSSLTVHGYINDLGYFIFCDAYSDTLPICTLDEQAVGLMMNYEITAVVKQELQSREYLEDHYNFVDSFEYRPWDAPTGYYDEKETEAVEVTSITGYCKKAFDFEIVLVEKEQNEEE